MDIIRTLYYIQGAWGDENIFAVLYVSLCYGPSLHIVIKQQFFYIYNNNNYNNTNVYGAIIMAEPLRE